MTKTPPRGARAWTEARGGGAFVDPADTATPVDRGAREVGFPVAGAGVGAAEEVAEAVAGRRALGSTCHWSAATGAATGHLE